MNLKQILCFKHDYRIMLYGFTSAKYKCTKCGAVKVLITEDKLHKKPKLRDRENFKTFTPLLLNR